MSDHTELKRVAEAHAQKDIDDPIESKRVMIVEPAEVLGLIAENERLKARLCMCSDCGGQGEVYSGHSTYHGHYQPPEPEMDVCGTCGGDGVLGPVEDFEALAAERDQLKRDNASLRGSCAKLGREHAGMVRAVRKMNSEIEKLKSQLLRADQIICDENKAASFARAKVCLLESDIEKLKAENEALLAAAQALRDEWRKDQADAERYRWLRVKQTFIWFIQDWFPRNNVLTDVDAEIDAAMGKGEQS